MVCPAKRVIKLAIFRSLSGDNTFVSEKKIIPPVKLCPKCSMNCKLSLCTTINFMKLLILYDHLYSYLRSIIYADCLAPVAFIVDVLKV